MFEGHTVLIIFCLFNVCLALFHKPLSLVVMKFFALGRKLGTTEDIKKTAKELKFEGFFDNEEIFNPSRDTVKRFLLWTGVINSIGIALFYFLVISQDDKWGEAVLDKTLEEESEK